MTFKNSYGKGFNYMQISKINSTEVAIVAFQGGSFVLFALD